MGTRTAKDRKVCTMSEELKRVMIIDDDELVAEFAAMTLQAVGLSVHYCASGERALEEITEFQPQLVLLDTMMPDMDGVETFKALRQLPAGAEVPIVFMTGKKTGPYQHTYAELGALGVIGKPFEAALLRKQLGTLWQQRSAA